MPADGKSDSRSTPPETGKRAKGDADESTEREFLPDPRRAASAITQAKKRLERPSIPGREPSE